MLAKGAEAMFLTVLVANVAFIKGTLLGAAMAIGGCACCKRLKGVRRC
jgi:hypothetical protein